jgi:hypothetical protein
MILDLKLNSCIIIIKNVSKNKIDKLFPKRTPHAIKEETKIERLIIGSITNLIGPKSITKGKVF